MIAVILEALILSVVLRHYSTIDRPVSRQKHTVPSIVLPATLPASKPQSSVKPFGMALGDTLPSKSKAALQNELQAIAKMGVTWIRVDVSWADVQPKNASSYNWAALDRVVAGARGQHLKVLGTLAYTPAWAAMSSCRDKYSRDCAPAHAAQFATFAAAAAKRYGRNGISAWEIWNEPNLQGFWQPAPSPQAYALVLKASYESIKQQDPNAPVITGGLGPLDNYPRSMRQQSFLTALYAAGARPYFDALGYHPYSYPTPPSLIKAWSGWSTMFDVPDSIQSIMATNHDSAKPIWITEYGAPTSGPGALATQYNLNFSAGPDHVSELLQAEMATQATAKYKLNPQLVNFF